MTKEDSAVPAEGAAAPAARTLFCGDFHPHLEDAFLEHMTGATGGGPVDPVCVVVPTNYLGMRLSRELAERSGGHLNVRFMTLRDLAARTAPFPLPGDRTVLPHGGDAVVVRRLLEDGIARGGYFSAIADRPGLAAVILKAISDLKEACYDPAALRAAADAAGLMRDGKRGKLAELLRIWSAYEGFLAERRFVDDSDAMRLAAEAMEEEARGTETVGHLSPGAASARGEDAARLEREDGDGRGRLVIYGFYDLNALQKRLVRARIGAGGATVFFPYADVPAMSYALPTLEWFLSLGFEKRALGGEMDELPLPPETIVMSSPGEAREAREAVRSMRDIVEERGLALQDVAFILRAPDVYSDILGNELDSLCDPGIEHRGLAESRTAFLETTSSLSRTRCGMALLKLALAARGGFARTDVIEFLSLADLDPSACGCPDGDPPVGEWNAVSTLAGVTSGAEQWRERVSSLAGRLEGADAEDPFAEAHAGLAAPAASLRNVVERTLGPLASSRPRATLDEYLHELTQVFRDVTRDTQERDTVLSAVARMAQVSELAGEVSFSYFCELLREYLDAPAPRGSRFGTGGPSVLSSMSARGLSYRVVVVPGLVEKQFPLHRRQDPILLDHERESLNRQTGMDPLRRLPPRGPGTDEERLLFRLAVGAASETVIVTYPRLDPATARPRVPSAFVLDVLERLSGRKQDYASLETSEHVLRVPLSRRFPASRDRALTRHEFDGCSVLSAVATGDAKGIAYLLSDEGQLKRRVEMEETRWSSPFFTKYDGALSFPEALAAAAACSGYSFDAETPGRAISATALEEYATCPFRFLAHHVLGIEPPDEPEDALEFTPLDRGSLYHDVLEKFMRRMLREDRLPLDESSLDTLLRMAADAVESGRWSLAGYEGARRLELRSLRLLLALWLRAEQRARSPLLPSYFEVRFGGAPRPGDDPTLSREEPLGFDAGEGVSIPLAGRIDRIDATADGSRARVVDYKTGNPKNVSKPLDRGRHLQLPVYLLAADELLADRGATTESAEYHFITNRPGARTKAFTRDDMDERLDDVRAALRCIVRGIETGMFFPYPESKGACRNCDYAPACGPVALALAQMKYGDPNAEFFFVELEEIK